MSLSSSFWSKASKTDCIVWHGAQNSKGYGCYAINGKSQLAHRLAWEDAHGSIPEGLTVDHICRNRSCVNVAHLELVTTGENTRRAIALNVGHECKRGHLISDEADLYRRKNGIVECRECRRTAKARWNSRSDIKALAKASAA